MGPALLTGTIVAAGCMLAAWGHAQRFGERVSNEYHRRIARRQLGGSGLGGFMGGTATGLGVAASGFEELSGFAMLGAIFALTGAFGVAFFLGARPAPSESRRYFNEAFLAALGCSGPWLFCFLWVACG